MTHVLAKTIISLVIIFSLSACEQEQAAYRPSFSEQAPDSANTIYLFGIHPLHNPKRLHELYGPIMTYINQHIDDAEFRVEASRNYQEFDQKLYAGKFDFALPNPFQTLNSLQHGYQVFGKMGDDYNFRGIFLVRRDSGIREPIDLKGKNVSYPAKTALAATMMPQYYLQTHGLNINHDIRNVYVGSQESSIMNVFLGHVSAAATWPIPWLAFQQQQPDKADQLELIWQTEPLINNGLVARKDMPPQLVQRVATLLTRLHESPLGQAMLAQLSLSRFELATDDDYLIVQNFLDDFHHAIPDQPE
ncbi:MAG: phosphate/phosphite/phosphonate ABC transporter substrate-binding protein [Gammaproteobacteria bacterium]|nr:phosphate/phosphite/phosphonate ABC transporter substrate-binding protein [Gammaproteobacteria bacterium]